MRLGILGGGQLGRMLALAAYPLGLRTTVYDPAEKPCAAEVCPHILGDYEQDYAQLFHLVQASDVISYEFENVPVDVVRWLADRLPVYPPPRALEVSQDRVAEKTFMQSLGIPTAPFQAVNTEADYEAALDLIGLPSVLKTCRFGYDGKGQAMLRTAADVDTAWLRLRGRPLILEGYVRFDRELSLIAARSRSGEIAFYPLIENQHQDGILHRSRFPAPDCGEELQERAAEYAALVMNALDYVGVLTIEWFQDGARLIANEIAPRVHNSGHATIEAAHTSQFEQHVRAIAGLPLAPCEVIRPAVMYNFIGSLPSAHEVLGYPAAHYHAYGKADRPGRKVGHVTLTAPSEEALEAQLPEWDRVFQRG